MKNAESTSVNIDWKKNWPVSLGDLTDSVKLMKHVAQYPDRWNAAFQFLYDTELDTLSLGTYDISDKDVYAIVSEYYPKDVNLCRFESHRNYIDLQYLIRGKENMGVTSMDDIHPITSYDEQNDIIFYDLKTDARYQVMDSTMFNVFFPDDPHRPSMKTDDSILVKKIVIKIKM